MKLALKYLSGILAISLVLILGFFLSGSIQDNAHLAYVRAQSSDVVMLVTASGGGGTGFLVRGKSGQTVIMTNQHICAAAENKPLIAMYGRDRFVVNKLKSYPKNDLCALEAPKVAGRGMWVASSVNFGERVYAIGHPLLEPITMTQGELSSTVRVEIQTGINVKKEDCEGETYRLLDLSENDFAKIFGVSNVCMRELYANSATINILPGNSGSPVVNNYGNVVGVVFAAVQSGVHSYIVPLYDLQLFLETL